MNAEAPAPEANPGLSPVKSVKSGGRRSYALLTLAFLLIGGYFLREQILFGLGQVLTSAEAPRKADLMPPGAWDSMAGAFEWSWDGRAPRVHLTDLVMTNGEARYEGSAETQSDGQVLLQVSDGTNKIQAAGALLQGEAL